MRNKLNLPVTAMMGLAFVMHAPKSIAQPYGQLLYNHNAVFLSSAIKTSINSTGFLMAGFRNNVGGGTSNFCIDKTGDGGALMIPGTFSNEYDIFWSGNGLCSPGSQVQMTECAGVSVMETSLTNPSRWYALAGVTGNAGSNYGLFFATLDQMGIPVDQAFYQLPVGSANPSKPLIVQYLGDFIIAGSYELSGIGYMYVLRLTPGVSTPVWSDLFSWNNTGSYIIPKDMVYSPLSPNTSAVIVGISNNGLNTTGDQGFLSMHWATFGGSPIDFLTVGHGNNNGVDQFHTIKWIPNQFGSSQFAVGGYTDYDLSIGERWMLFGDGQFNIQFSKIYGPVNDITGTIVDIEDRYSSTYFATELYALATSPSGMMVLKTDMAGVPFAPTVGPSNPDNEFLYNSQPSTVSSPVAITKGTNPGGPDEGLQIFGTQNQVIGNGFYFVDSYFNGESACPPGVHQTINTFVTHASIPSLKASTVPPRTGGLSACQNFNINVTAVTNNAIQLCGGVPFVPTGSNARVNVSLATGINTTEDGTGLKCFMNGSSLEIISEINPEDVRVFDQLGKTIWQGMMDPKGAGRLSIDASRWKPGVYYIQSQTGGIAVYRKVIK